MDSRASQIEHKGVRFRYAEPWRSWTEPALVRESEPTDQERMEPAPAGAPLERLSERARAGMQLRRLSTRTQKAYLGWMRRFWLYHGRRDPATLSVTDVTRFPSDLATRQSVAASNQNQTLATIPCLYRDVLGQKLLWLERSGARQDQATRLGGAHISRGSGRPVEARGNPTYHRHAPVRLGPAPPPMPSP